ncbi:hypothetical protein WJX74_009077 [Apatococcus lobatus]|uniref:Uncharacterized protein n=1 Tax=Apatococcus lobatus TaxID=904363 RepID=A0AAW1RT09_9CHLO
MPRRPLLERAYRPASSYPTGTNKQGGFFWRGYLSNPDKTSRQAPPLPELRRETANLQPGGPGAKARSQGYPDPVTRALPSPLPPSAVQQHQAGGCIQASNVADGTRASWAQHINCQHGCFQSW